jgi:hypothetical protein
VGLLEPMFNELGFQLEAGKGSGDTAESDYPLTLAGQTLALYLACPWDRFLDDRRDNEPAQHNPGQRVVSLLERAEAAAWVIVTNGML